MDPASLILTGEPVAINTSVIFQFVVLIILVFLSAFFSSAETAFSTANRIKMRSMSEEGNKNATLVLKILDSYSKLLSAILIGNNVVNLYASSLATTIAINLSTPLGLTVSLATGLATGILTVVVLLSGEIIPKTGHSYGDWTEIDDTQEQRVCATCGDTETREKADMSQVDAFKDLVEAVKNAEGMNTKWNVIKSALNAYNELDDSEKELVVDAYETLQEEINAYNNLAIATNAESNKATQQAIALLIGSISILSVAAYFLLKR